MKVDSPTMAAAAMYEDNRASLDDFTKAFAPVDNQTGALFVINGKAIGFDLFDSGKPFRSMLPSLVQSYALDALDVLITNDNHNEKQKPVAPQLAQALLADCVQAAVNRFPALGEGSDLRLQGDGLTGGALEVDEKIVHLCAFRLPETEPDAENRSRRSCLARASVRRDRTIY
jgi:hypothetical protein